MKKVITNILLIGSLVIILDSINFYSAVIEFLFAGIIPGFDYRINPNIMLMLFSVLTGTLIGVIVIMPLIKKYEISKIKN